MDKNTLSNYGWIVIAVLVLSVMIALATPFGSYVQKGTENTLQGLINVSDDAVTLALDSTKPREPKANDGIYDYGKNDPDLNHNNVIPEGGKYYDASENKYFTGGESFPNPELDDIYEFGEYKYKINYLDNEHFKGFYCYTWLTASRDKVEYTPVLESINNIKDLSLANVYSGCYNLKYAPHLPDGVFVGCNTFLNCTSLISVPTLPSGLISVDNMFDGCTSLLDAPNMSKCKKLADADYMFANCTSLTKAPDMSNIQSVDMNRMFMGCTSLKTIEKLPQTITVMQYAFADCVSLVSVPLIPNGVTNMTATFQNCTSLIDKPTIPNSATTPEDEIFVGCTQFGY